MYTNGLSLEKAHLILSRECGQQEDFSEEAAIDRNAEKHKKNVRIPHL